MHKVNTLYLMNRLCQVFHIKVYFIKTKFNLLKFSKIGNNLFKKKNIHNILITLILLNVL